MNDDNNIVQFGAIPGGKDNKDARVSHPYVIYDIDGNEHYAEGFLLFTSHHVCVMENMESNPVTGLMVPLSRVKLATLVEDDYDDED